jgi:hypothetical protein
VEEKREEIRRYFHATHSLDERLYDTLASPDAFYLRPEPLRHPLIFYLGHTATFYINKLIVAKITNQRINPRFESMLSVGVDEMSWDDLDEAHYDWPTPAEVKAYRDQVRTVVRGGARGTSPEEAVRVIPLVKCVARITGVMFPLNRNTDDAEDPAGPGATPFRSAGKGEDGRVIKPSLRAFGPKMGLDRLTGSRSNYTMVR